MKIRTVIITVLVLLFFFGQRTQPAATEADCCFFHLRRLGGICSGQEIFLAPSLNAAWNLGFNFFLQPLPRPLFSLHLFHIFLPQL